MIGQSSARYRNTDLGIRENETAQELAMGKDFGWVELEGSEEKAGTSTT